MYHNTIATIVFYIIGYSEALIFAYQSSFAAGIPIGGIIGIIIVCILILCLIVGIPALLWRIRTPQSKLFT